MLEKSIERSIVNWCKKQGLQCYKVALINQRGWPDRLIPLPGNVSVWLEIKTDVGRLSPQQKVIHAELAKLGHTVHVVRSLQEAQDAITQISNRSQGLCN